MPKRPYNESDPRPAITGGQSPKSRTAPQADAGATPKRGSRNDIEHTLNEWALMTGRDDKTLVSAFRKIDYFPKPGDRIPFKFVESALFGEEHAEKVKALRLDNRERERRDKEREGELVNFAEVEHAISECLISPLSSILRDLPTTMDTRCNPQDPLLARHALTDWVEKTCKPILRNKLPKPEVKP